jgi:hypothetical protein
MVCLYSIHYNIDTNQPFLALSALSALTVNDTPTDVFSTPPQLDGELITLTLLPRARWQTLLNLEVIHVRLSLHVVIYFSSFLGLATE